MIKEISDETEVSMSREEFLAVCVKSRLEELENSYEKDFEKFINTIETHIDYKDYDKISSFLIGISRSINSSYQYLIKTLKIIQNKD